MVTDIIGWDIGGANLKAARFSPAGWQVAQQPFPIWQRRDDLAAALAGLAARLGPASRAAVTITAELSDAFRTKREGIAFVLDAVRAALPDVEIAVFGLDGRFHDPATAGRQPLLVAAANWLATALWAARHDPDGLLVDIGSTTTDITPVAAGRVLAEGRTDPDRLLRGELLYTGALRTPVCAVVRRVPLWGGWCPVAAEHFATTQDVHLLLGQLAPAQCTSPTADGRPATPEFAAERLARVVCADVELLDRSQLVAMARYIANEQIGQVSAALAQVLARPPVTGPILVVGVGAFLAEAAAARLGLACRAPAALSDSATGDVAPAAAVALLLEEMTTDNRQLKTQNSKLPPWSFDIFE